VHQYIFLFSTPGWYVATNGNICSWAFLLFQSRLSSGEGDFRIIFSVSTKFLGYPRASRRVLKSERDSRKFFSEEFVRRSLIALPLIKPLLTSGGWQEGVMCVLKCFSRFMAFLYVKDSVFLESFSFINNCIKECDFLDWNFSCKFYCWMKTACLFKK